MFCKNCGSQIPDGSIMCSNCGAVVSPAAASDPISQAPQQHAYQQPAHQQMYQQMPQQPTYQQAAYQQPGYQQPGYQQPVYQPNAYQQVRNPNDGRGLSITALVLGICGVVLSWVSVINVIVLAAGILGIIFGYKGRQKSIIAYGKPSGLATAGFILGIIGTSICGLGVLSCTICAAAVSGCSSCGSACTSAALSDMLR